MSFGKPGTCKQFLDTRFKHLFMQPYIIIYSFPALFLSSCTSIPEKVKQEKEKFIEVARENSKFIDISEIPDLMERSKENNTESKMKYLGIDEMKVVYVLDNNNRVLLDSVVIFKKSGYTILYDFAETDRPFNQMKEKSKLKNFEVAGERLYIGEN